jgi:triosephosphate isomerase
MKNWVVGNWKMHGSLSMVTRFIPTLLDGLTEVRGWEQAARVLICPPFPYIAPVAQKLTGYAVGVGAQDVHPLHQGAFTGEVAAPMLAELGVSACIVGHSERRRYNRESDALIGDKLRAVVTAGITPILCVGETLSQREAGRERQVVKRQVMSALKGLEPAAFAKVAVAYEPVWAIGTGRTATPEQANEMHQYIRTLLCANLSPEHGSATPLLYGGSVTPDNAARLLALPDINGALVGGASLKAESFLSILKHSLN